MVAAWYAWAVAYDAVYVAIVESEADWAVAPVCDAVDGAGDAVEMAVGSGYADGGGECPSSVSDDV